MATAAAACWLASAAGCEIDRPPAGFATCAPEPPPPDAGVVPDYWHDAKPILDSQCASCHVAGGIGPFPIVSLADVTTWGGLMREAIGSGEMPPWPPNDCCGSYRHNRSLSAADRDTLLRWLDAGAPEGDPTGAPPSQPPPPPALSRVDLTLRMPTQYTPVATEETSELRCFLIEGWPFVEEKYITGIDVRPANRSIVHHVIVQTVGLGDVPEIRSREGRDGRPGFDCRNLRSDVHVNGGVGGWVPGTTPRESPDGTIGVRFPANSQVLLQVHYDIRNGVTTPDQIEIDFQIADEVKHRGKGMVVTNPLWLAGNALEIEAGNSDVMYNFAYDPTVLFTRGDPLYIHLVELHMHFVGSYGRVAIQRADGSWDCLLDIPKWDYHWAGSYELTEPVQVRPGDMLYVECHWDNSAANQVPVSGARPPPRDLVWATADEMCAGIMLYTESWP
jgi:hypothetical protein